MFSWNGKIGRTSEQECYEKFKANVCRFFWIEMIVFSSEPLSLRCQFHTKGLHTVHQTILVWSITYQLWSMLPPLCRSVGLVYKWTHKRIIISLSLICTDHCKWRIFQSRIPSGKREKRTWINNQKSDKVHKNREVLKMLKQRRFNQPAKKLHQQYTM